MACLVPWGDVTPQTTINVSIPYQPTVVQNYEIHSDLSSHYLGRGWL